MKKDYKFLVYSIFQCVNTLFLVLVFFGIAFWRGDKQVKAAFKGFEDKSNVILTNSLNVVSNAYLLLTFAIEEGKSFNFNNEGFNNTTNTYHKDKPLSLNPSKIGLCSFGGVVFCRINGMEHYFKLGDYWLDKSPIVEITDYYLRTEKDIYFLQQKIERGDFVNDRHSRVDS